MPLPDDTLQIDTPENVAFGYEIASIGSRFLATSVDTILIILLQVIIGLILIILTGNSFSVSLEEESNLIAWLIAIAGLLIFSIYWGYYIFFEMAWNGQSPGKRWVGLRVIRMDGTPITLTESIIRNLVRVVDLLPSFYGVGVVTMFITEQSRRLGDLAAGTLVVHDRSSITLDSLETAPHISRRALAQTPIPDLPVERLTQSDLRMAEEFLRRRDKLFNREELSMRIVRSLNERMGLEDQPVFRSEAEALIEQIVQASHNRQSG